MARFRSYVGLILFVTIAIAVPTADRLLNGSGGEAHHQQLLTEWQSVQPMESAGVVSATNDYSRWRPRQALVGATYVTSASSEVIRNHYDQQFTAHGWKFQGERRLKDWGRDLGGSTLNYCKGSMLASLQFAGTQAQYGWTFAVDVSWGLHSSVCA